MANTLYELEKYKEALDAINKAIIIKEDELMRKLKGIYSLNSVNMRML